MRARSAETSRPRRWLRRLAELSGAEIRAFVQAWVLLLAADVALRLLPYPRVERWLAPAPRPDRADEAAVPRLAWATAAAARRHLYPMRCLPQSLCLRWLLARHGIAAELRLGVERRRGELRAHAWVERAGLPVGDAPSVAARWTPLRSA